MAFGNMEYDTNQQQPMESRHVTPQYGIGQVLAVELNSNAPSSSIDIHNQSRFTPNDPPIRHLPERINQGIPKPSYEADPKCKHKYLVSEPNLDSG